jgi:4-amino-4-deoxy-L-arabinose transferase-like glycosyltransferase
MSSPRHALGMLAIFSLARAALAPAFDLMPQSAYYFTYAEHPALSYYDHPPMLGWLLLAGALLLGKSTLAVRATVFATTLATQLAFYALARRLLAPEPASRALVLLTTGGIALLLSWIAVPDVPLLLFWTLALLALDRALGGVAGEAGTARGPTERAGRWWLAAGAAMGLAFLGKYTALFLQGGLVLFLLASREDRRWLRTPWPWASLALAHVVSLPVYLWNARHDFASFRYQFLGRAAESRVNPDDVLGFLASQAMVLLPVAFVAFLWAGGRWTAPLLRGRLPARRDLFLLAFSVPLFATCLGLSVLTWVKSNWPMPAYLTGLLLAAGVTGRRAVRWQTTIGAALLLAVAVQVLWYPVPVKSDDTWYGWRELAGEVEELAARHPEAFLFAVDHYKTTAELRFYSGLRVYGMNVIGWNALQYEYLGEDLEALAGRDALLIASEPRLAPSAGTEHDLARTRRYFSSVEELEPIRIRRRGEVVRLFRVFLCRGYRGPARDPGGTIAPP